MRQARIRRRRLRVARGQDRSIGVGGPRHRAGGHRLRAGLADRVRLPAHRQAVAARAAAGRCARRCSRATRPTSAWAAGTTGRPGSSGSSIAAVARLLQPRALRAARRRVDPHRRAHRRRHRRLHREWLLIRPRTDWAVGRTTYPAGSLLAANYDEFLAGTAELSVVFEPDEHTSLEHYAWTRDRLVLVTLADVASRVEIVTPGTWERAADRGHPAQHQHRDRRRRRRTATRSSWTPAVSTPRRGCCGAPAAARSTQIKSAPAFFDAADIEVTQHFVDVGGRHDDPVLRRRASRFDGPGPDPARRLRRLRELAARRATAACWAGCGWRAAAPTCWPTSAAAASTGPRWHTQAMREGRHLVARGLRRGRKRSGGPRHHHRRRSWARRAAATAAC